jgi:hypothetical protein
VSYRDHRCCEFSPHRPQTMTVVVFRVSMIDESYAQQGGLEKKRGSHYSDGFTKLSHGGATVYALAQYVRIFGGTSGIERSSHQAEDFTARSNSGLSRNYLDAEQRNIDAVGPEPIDSASLLLT